jgi:DNA primase
VAGKYRRAKTPAQTAATAKAREEQLTALQGRLTDHVRAITSGPAWAAWLASAAKFHSYSFRNTVLIQMQAPDATRVGGYNTWKAVGRQVSKGEKGIAILAPVVRKVEVDAEAQDTSTQTEERRRIVAFTQAYVFDISQTQGEPLPEPPRPTLLQGQAPEGLWDQLATQVHAARFELQRGPCGTANGITNYETRTVTVRDDVDDLQATKTLLHELSHALLHDPSFFTDPTTALCRGDAEVEAESVAYLVAAAQGMSTDDYSFPYIAGWIGRRDPAEVLQATGRRVLATAHTILDGINATDMVAVSSDLARIRERGQVGAERASALLESASAETSTASDAQLDELRALLTDAQTFYVEQYPDTWAPTYIESRFGQAVANDASWGFGRAPSEWTALTDHLRGLGYADEALEASGVCLRTRKGTLVDRFRDRLTLPVHDRAGQVVSFVGRRNPANDDERAPKYLNGAQSPLFSKGEHLFGIAGPGLVGLERGARAVLVEGPLDAVAITAGTGGRAVGVASLGTALTEAQAELFTELYARAGQQITVATDPDRAGRAAAERAYFALAGRGQNPKAAALPNGVDPAQLLTDRGELAVVEAVEDGPDLARAVIDHRLAERGRVDSVEERVSAARYATQVLAPLGQDKWEQHIAHIAERLDVTPTTVHEMVVQAAAAAGRGVQGRLRGRDRLEDLDRGQFVPRTAREIAGEGLSTTFAVRRLAPVPGTGRGQVSARPTEPHAVDRGR